MFSASTDTTLSCPRCRHVSVVGNSVHALRKNYAILGLLHSSSASDEDDDDEEADDDDKNDDEEDEDENSRRRCSSRQNHASSSDCSGKPGAIYFTALFLL